MLSLPDTPLESTGTELDIPSTQVVPNDGTQQIVIQEADGSIIVTTIDAASGELLVSSEPNQGGDTQVY